jgi:hypothetical protein
MPGPRRLQAVKNLGRYTDVMGLANGGTADEEEAVKALLYGMAQGPYGPLLAYDIPEPNLAPVAPKPEPEKPRVTQPTKATIDDYGYEYTPPTGRAGTYNQEINDVLTDMVARGSYGPTGLAGRGLGHAAEIAYGRLMNALGREKTPAELAAMPLDAIAVPRSADDIAREAFYAEYGITPSAPTEGGPESGVSPATGAGFDGLSAPVDGPAGVYGFAQGGPVHMEDGGFVLTERAVKGAGGPRGLAAALPQARMIRGPGTGTSDSIPATISGPRGQTPARVSNGEAYVPRRAVQQAGGPKRMYGLMSALERKA